MNRNKAFVLFCLVFCGAMIFSSCGPNTNYIKRVQSLEENVSSPTTIDELKDAIKKYQDRVEDIIAAESQTGIWYKILATRYIDNKMYAEALNALQRAITYYPTNQNLYYYVGVCAGYMANSALDFDVDGYNPERINYLKLSESGYLRALELESTYARALYGLSVLYVYELDRSYDAIPLLEKLLTIDTKDVDAMFLLGHAYYLNYEFQLAADMYERVAKTTTSDKTRQEAEADKKIALDALYG